MRQNSGREENEMKFEITASRNVDTNIKGAYSRETLKFYIHASCLEIAYEKGKKEIMDVWEKLEWVEISICQMKKEDK